MEAPQQNMISNTGKAASIALEQLFPLVQQIKTLYSGTPNWDALITQAEIDSVPSFQAAGLTKADLNDAIYCLGQMNIEVTTRLTAIIMLANL